MPSGQPPIATVLITTRDRRERVRTAIRSSLAQTAAPEVIVMDDASSDGTEAAIRREFPQVRVVRCESSIGCPGQRNRGVALARGPIVICLDDDAYFSSPDTVAQVACEFDDPRIGVVTIPYVNVRREQHVRQQAPDDGWWATGVFAGGASAVLREAFQGAGGYADIREQGEEAELAIRLLDLGYIVRLGRADHIVHDEELVAKPPRTYVASTRNHFVGTWRSVPWPHMPARLAVLTGKLLVVGVVDRQLPATLRGLEAAARACLAGRTRRTPVRRSTYALFRRLARRGPLPFASVEPHLRPIAGSPPDIGEGAGRPLHVVSVMTTHAAGGAEFAAVDMLDALARRGARVRLLTNRCDLVDGTGVDAAPIELGPKLGRRSLARVAARAPLTLAQLVAALRREARLAPIDVLLLHYKKEQLLSMLLPRSLAGGVVWAEWGPLPPGLRHGVPRRAYALAARAAGAIIAESRDTEQSLLRAGVRPDRIAVIPNVLDAEHLAFDPAARLEYRRAWDAEGAFVLGCVSRLDAAKRIDVAIDALEHVDDTVMLVIAGEGDDERRLRSRAARFGSRVRFVGGARGRVAQILSACDAQVYAPSPSEGAARAITFGQLVGRPVIATAPQGAHELVVAGTGTIVSPPHDAHALARCIERYRCDPARLAEEGAAGRRHALRRIAEADAVAELERVLRGVGGSASGHPVGGLG